MKRYFSACLLAMTLTTSAVQAQTTRPTVITIDTTQRKPISPFIYGVNFPDWKGIGLPFTVARQGGNRMSAYNWETNASNAGADYHHQNDSHLSASNEPGLYVREFLEATRSHGAVTILTVPMTGYVAADKNGDGDVNKTQDYLQTRFYRSLPSKSGTKMYPPDTTDKTVYQDEFVAYIERIKGVAPVWYSLDNEPDIWSGTHARIVPQNPTYADIIGRSIEYARAIKAVAPRATITGPASYGWQGFRRFQNASDANNRDFLDVYLSAMRNAEKKEGKRLLDVLDVHWYPEARGDDTRVTEESPKPGVAIARIQAPRSLWDLTYVENSWIANSIGNRPIALISGLQKQIATQYPGTKLAITEYNYGGGKDISGAIAQADVLGIYGRYGVYAACNWGIGAPATAQVAGFRAYLNFDGKGAHFGDMGLEVQGVNPAELSVYAALDTKKAGRATIVAINKTNAVQPLRLAMKGFSPRTAKAYSITQQSLASSHPLAAKIDAGNVSFTLPPLSVVTLEVMR